MHYSKLLFMWCFLFVNPVTSQVCNSLSSTSGALLIPAFSTGGSKSTWYDPTIKTRKGEPTSTGTGCAITTDNMEDKTNETKMYCGFPSSDPQPMAIVYLLLLLWFFMGVGLFADVFMGAIEVITSKKRYIDVKDDDGKEKTVEIYTWNDTVANLTLMALGSSAPEILLSVIEICGNKFESGDLGPSTIVGSAAFNLMVIIAVCVSGIPPKNESTGETGIRTIAQMGVFNITAFSSLFAYIWLLIVLQVISPNIVTLGESLITFLFFPALVIVAWLLDTGKCKGCVETKSPGKGEYLTAIGGEKGEMAKVAQFRDIHEVNELLKKDKMEKKEATYHGKDPDKLAAVAFAMYFKETKVSRAQYRVNANRHLMGGKAVLPEMVDIKDDPKEDEVKVDARIYFAAVKYNILESSSEVILKVHCDRSTGQEEGVFTVDYKTGDESDTATPDADYKSAEGTLTFNAGESEHEVKITIIQDDEEEDDEVFTIKLSNGDGTGSGTVRILETSKEAKVTIIDDESHGEIEFAPHKEESETKLKTCYRVVESDGDVAIKVVRKGGSSGKATIHFKTEDGQGSHKALAGYDYEAREGDLVFEMGEVEKYIVIKIIDDDEFEKDEIFYLNLSDPKGCEIGCITVCKIIIENDDEMKGLGKQVVQLLNINLDKYKLGSSDWKGQFTEAIESPPSDASCMGKITNRLTIPFKLLCALIPPTAFAGGWLCFVISLIAIGIVTALIGDFATLFGCSVGLSDSVTAITVVALGTSLPDTFASIAAAVGDATADNAIGNVTGSNSVNVFLGLGLPWLMASIYHMAQGTVFKVPAGSLGFSVTIFSICAVISLGIIYARGYFFNAELGGPYTKPTSVILVSLWLLYLVLSILKDEGIINM